MPERWRARLSGAVASAVQTLRDSHAVRAGLAWSTLNWLLDAGCLWVCLRAYGADLPIELVVSAYGLANALGLLPLTPGGLGIIEGTLVPALVAAGASAGVALLGVVTWRLLQYWLPIPVAGLCWLSLGRAGGRWSRTSGP